MRAAVECSRAWAMIASSEIVSIKPSPNKAGVFRCVTTTPLGLRLVRSVSVARGIEGLAGKLA